MTGRPCTAVTGPPRSGTSCTAGLLERAGFDLGRALWVDRRPSEHNPRGHFEVGVLGVVSSEIIAAAGGDGFGVVPTAEALRAAAERHEHGFRLFRERFDGDLVKDPRLCLTWPLWQERWPALQRAVLCLRHPLDTTASIVRRYRVRPADALGCWQAYTCRLLDAVDPAHVVVFDFDAFLDTPAARLAALLARLGRPCDLPTVSSALDGFLVPRAPTTRHAFELPANVARLYETLRDRADEQLATRPTEVAPCS